MAKTNCKGITVRIPFVWGWVGPRFSSVQPKVVGTPSYAVFAWDIVGGCMRLLHTPSSCYIASTFLSILSSKEFNCDCIQRLLVAGLSIPLLVISISKPM